ncbi:MAG TPA: PAS domain S-box protein, partial [Coleofasciculaceae cyanobacterium]
MTLELYVESVETAYLNGNYETVKTLYTVVFERAKTVLEKISSIPKTTTNALRTNTEIASTLDLKSILKASQTLSSELSLETLLTKMMGIVLENAGAQKGYLILKQDGQWVIEASGTIASDEVQVLQSIPLAAVSGNSETPMVSNAIANYVIRTQTTLVLDDAAYEGDFTHDPYILKQQPKSILCMPLLNQGTLIGILYLENNLIPGAFTPDRLEVLNLLSPQVAISIENAKVYAQLRESESKWTQILEAEVSQRTAELTQINQQLEREIADRKVAEITLKQQKELLQAIFDHLPVMLSFYDTNAQVLLANRAMEHILGWSLEELRQIDILTECYPDPDYRASVFEFMIRADGRWRDLQTKTRDGRWLETSWANVRLPDGSHLGIGQDITERKRAEQALRDSEERFREIAETISQFFFVRSITSGRYLYANPAYERIWGRTCESLYQNPQSWLETIHPDDRSFVQNSIQKQYQGTPVKREYRIIRPDGQVRWIVADISVVCDETGQPQRFVGLAEDITERKQAEQALRESENRFRAVFEKAAVGIGLCTLEGRFFRANQKLCSIVGYTDIEMLERTFEQITPVKDRPQMRDFTQQLLAGEIENYSLEHRYICKDGSIAWVNVAVSLMHEPAGEPNSFIYVAEDISDRKLAELALVKSEHALAEAQRLAHLGNWSFDLLTRELTWSEETFRIYGLDPTQGEPTEEEHLQQLHPDDREKVLRSIELAVTQGRPYEHEIRIFLPNGSMRYTLRRGQPVLNEMGQVVKLFGTVQDITERKQAEEELRESEEKFRQLAENIEEVFFILSHTGELLYISPAYEHIWGKTCQSLYHNSCSWLESVHPEEQPAILAALNHQIRDTAEFDQTYRIVRAEGEIRWIRARSFPIEHQNSHRFVGIAEDISDRKLAEDALQQAKEAAEAANQAKSAFLANMSHELRTPLNAILGFAQLLNRSSSLPPEHQKNITTIIRSGEHLLTLINQILDLSKIEAGRTTLNETSFDLYNFLEDVKDMFQLKANNKGLQLRFEYSSDLPQYVRTDEVKLRQILINLLSNGIKFTASGHVSLCVGRGISKVQKNTNSQFPIPNSQFPILNFPLHFEIEDTGSGIAPDELESIFEAFVQTKTGQQYREGTGLGLTISRKFVQLMGGEISITSEVGKGTIIAFDIQATAVEAAAIESKLPLRRVIALEPNQPLYRILIVDDRTDNRQVLIEL